MKKYLLSVVIVINYDVFVEIMRTVKFVPIIWFENY